MKRSQMELIGIAIIVILMSLGILFMLSFGISDKGSSFKQEFTNKELVSNTLSTLLRVKAYHCGDLTIEDILQDCFMMDSFVCETEQGSLTSCDYVSQVTSDIFSKTFDKWDRSYFFEISKSVFPTPVPSAVIIVLISSF